MARTKVQMTGALKQVIVYWRLKNSGCILCRLIEVVDERELERDTERRDIRQLAKVGRGRKWGQMKKNFH